MRVLTIHLIGYWGYLWGLFGLAGFAGLRLVHRVVPRPLTDYRMTELVWFGMAVVTWLGVIASLAMPVAGGVHAIVAGAALAYGLWDRRALAEYATGRVNAWRRHGSSLIWRIPLAIALVAALVAYTAFNSGGTPSCYDTLLYHAQSVRWLKEYGTVQGLANLNTRIGFNNAWFVTAAVVDTGPFTFKSFHVINSFAYIVTTAALAWRLVDGFGAPLCLSRLFDALMLYPLLRYRQNINSLSTDVASTLIIVALISHALHRCDDADRPRRDMCWVAVVAAFSAAVKLVNIPLLLLPFLMHRADPEAGTERTPQRRAAFTRVAGYGALMGIVFLPWLVRGYYLSGYLLYPLQALDLFSPDWKVPASVAASDQDWIRSWARMPRVPPEQVLGAGVGYWFGPWFQRSSTRLDGFILWSITGLVVTAAFLRPVTRQVARCWPVLVTLVAGLVFWFVQAPDVRFGYGYLTATQMLIVSLILAIALDTLTEQGRRVSATVLVTSLAIHLHGTLSEDVTERCRSLTRTLADYPHPAMQPYTYASGLRIQIPVENDLCANEPLPCSPGTDRDKVVLEARGSALKDGFRVRPRPDGQ